jgi:hypothetical protein
MAREERVRPLTVHLVAGLEVVLFKQLTYAREPPGAPSPANGGLHRLDGENRVVLTILYKQRPRRDQDMDEDAESSASDNEHGFQQGDDEFAEANDGQATDSDERPQRAERPQRGERFNRQDRPRRPNDGDDQRSARPSRDGDDSDPMNGGETIPFDVLPPAIGRDETDSGDAEAAPKRPRRRARTPRPEEGEDEAAPAA